MSYPHKCLRLIWGEDEMFCQMWIPAVWQADPHVLEIQFNCFSTTRVLLATVALAVCYLRVDDSDLISVLCRSCGSGCFYLTNLAAYLICNFYGAMTRNIHMFLWTTTNFIYLYCVMLSFLAAPKLNFIVCQLSCLLDAPKIQCNFVYQLVWLDLSQVNCSCYKIDGYCPIGSVEQK